MADRQVAVDVACLDCGASVLRTEASPGDSITIPAHTCEETS